MVPTHAPTLDGELGSSNRLRWVWADGANFLGDAGVQTS